MQCARINNSGNCTLPRTSQENCLNTHSQLRTKIYFPGSLPFSDAEFGDDMQTRWCCAPLKKEMDTSFTQLSFKSLEQLWSGVTPRKLQSLGNCKIFDQCFDKILQDAKESQVNACATVLSCSRSKTAKRSQGGIENTLSSASDLTRSTNLYDTGSNNSYKNPEESCNTKSKPQRAAKKKISRHENAWGGPTYTELITKAILSAPEQRLTLSQIYEWLAQNVEYFRERSNYNSSQGWKNAIRHTLSLRKRFVRVPRVSAANTWYSSWWTVIPEHLGDKI